ALSGELHSNVKLSMMEDSSLVSDSIISHPFSARNDRAWATFIGDWQERGDGTDHTPFSSHSKGIVFGADQGQYGVAFAYLYNNYHQKDFSYNAKGHTLSLTAYGAEDLGKGFTLRGGMGYGLHTINSKRNIVLGSFNENLKSTYYAHHVQTFGEIAYPMEGFEPYARVTHTYLYTPDFSETGGETALTSHKNHGQLGSTTIGFKTSTALNLTDRVQTKLTASAAWQHTFGNINPSGEYSFTDSAHFQSSAAPAAQDALQLTTGMSFEFDGGVTIDLSYSGILAHNAERHGLIGTVNWRF
ncbi:MAG: autotransporter domain-containing protein, partial [Bdellovibrionales bacterium]